MNDKELKEYLEALQSVIQEDASTPESIHAAFAEIAKSTGDAELIAQFPA